jgi:outer membrane protein assembly factor BamA
MLTTVMLVLQVAAAAEVPAPAQGANERVVATQVHGNVVTTSDDVLKLAGIIIGMPVTDDALWEAQEKLVASGLFESVEIRKRYASLDDSTQVLLVVVVDEGDIRLERTDDPDNPVRAVRRTGPRLMLLPIFEVEYAYGLTYGARVTFPEAVGEGSQLSVPLSWGGYKQAAVELARVFGRDNVTRLAGGGLLEQRENPFFDEDDTRQRLWARVDRGVWRHLWAGTHVAWENAEMGDADDRLTYVGVDATFDGRRDPYLARDALFGHVAWERVFVDDGDTTDRTRLEGRGYLGLFWQSTLVARALKEDADGGLPPYLLPVLGGGDNLRGFPAGTAVGDTLVAGTLEWRVPVTSPLGIGRVGLSAFVDAGTVYAEGEELGDQSFRYGVGGGVWFSMPLIRLTMSVAHGIDGPTTFHIASGMSF